MLKLGPERGAALLAREPDLQLSKSEGTRARTGKGQGGSAQLTGGGRLARGPGCAGRWRRAMWGASPGFHMETAEAP